MGIRGKVCGDCKYHDSEQNICTNVKGYKMYASKCSGACHDFTKSSLFDKITASPAALSDKLVYCEEPERLCECASWRSVILDNISFASREEAFAATIEKLKEVQ